MSQRDRALQAIREVIFSGKLPVGQRTSERLLTKNFLVGTGVGRTPVREALAILTELGIVEQYPQSGFVVRNVDAREATKVLALQRVTERLVVAEAARNQLDTRQLDRIVDELSDAARHGESQELVELARTFHVTLTRAAGYGSAADPIGGFRDRFALFIAETRRPLDKQEQSDAASAYRDLLLAIAADSTGVQGMDCLDRLIKTETGFVSARGAVDALVARSVAYTPAVLEGAVALKRSN